MTNTILNDLRAYLGKHVVANEEAGGHRYHIEGLCIGITEYLKGQPDLLLELANGGKEWIPLDCIESVSQPRL